MHPFQPASGRVLQKGDWKLIASRGQLLATTDLVAGTCIGRRREKTMDLFFAGVLANAVGQQENACFFILTLPGVEETVGSTEGGDIVRVDGGGWRFGLGE